MTPSVVDIHCHFIPPALIEKLDAEGSRHSIEVLEKDGKRYVSWGGRDRTQPFPPGMLDLEERLRWMDGAGIDVQVLSAWMDFSAYVLDAEDGAWLTRNLNDLTAEAIAGRGDRFRALAAVPLQAPEHAVAELGRAMDELGMVGAEIGTSIGDDELDEERFDVFWAAAQERKALILVHPYGSLGSERLKRYFLWNSVANPAEETVAAAHLIFGGVLERFPGLDVCLTHGGGFLPYQIGRQDRGFVAKADVAATRLSSLPSGLLQRFFYDTIVHDPEALRFLVDRVGADRVVLGSDQPFPMGDPDPVATVRSAGLPDEAVDAILGGNLHPFLERARDETQQ